MGKLLIININSFKCIKDSRCVTSCRKVFKGVMTWIKKKKKKKKQTKIFPYKINRHLFFCSGKLRTLVYPDTTLQSHTIKANGSSVANIKEGSLNLQFKKEKKKKEKAEDS